MIHQLLLVGQLMVTTQVVVVVVMQTMIVYMLIKMVAVVQAQVFIRTYSQIMLCKLILTTISSKLLFQVIQIMVGVIHMDSHLQHHQTLGSAHLSVKVVALVHIQMTFQHQ